MIDEPPPLTIGMDVFDLYGRPVGRVDELRSDFFRVARPWRRRYWLRPGHVFRAEGTAVQLILPTEVIPRYRVWRVPGTGPAAPSTVAAQGG